jgi:hypothetical protein
MKSRTLLLVSLLLSLAITASAQPAPRNNERVPVLKESQIEGTVESVRGDEAIVRTQEGWKVNVNLGPERFWRERGYRLEPGVRVHVRGWRQGDDFEGPFFAGTIWGPHFRFTLTNEAGYPFWADPADCAAGWYPTWDDYYYLYWGPYGPRWWAYGPPPPPPAPPMWWRHHHPGRRGHGPGRYYDDRGPRGHGDDRGRWDNNRDNRNDRGHDNNGDNNNNGDHKRDGRHGG